MATNFEANPNQTPTQKQQHLRALRSFETAVPDHSSWTDNLETSRPNTSPLTGLELPRICQTEAGNMEDVFQRAKIAQLKWKNTPVRERAKILRNFESLMWKYRDEILDIIQWETGKARKHAIEELLDVSQNIGYLSAKGPKILKTKKTSGAVPLLSSAQIAHLPIGVVGMIAPWNYPFTLAISDAAAALLAGNSVVLKPASQTPLSAVVVTSLLARSGLPAGVFQLTAGPGGSIGDHITSRSDFVMFTGSTQVGKNIAQACGQRLIGCSAELGGKNPSIVFPDADLELWAKTAMRESFSSTGQLCVSIERMYIHEDIWDKALDLLRKEIGTLNGGRDFSWNTDFGPLVSEAHFKTVLSQVQDATNKGATVIAGGEPLPQLGPTGFQPTLLTGVTPDMEVFAHETFGPVVSLYKWSDPEEVIAQANATDYGLNGSVWSQNSKVATLTGRALKVGSISVNEGYGATWGSVEAPIGGMSESGLGRRHGPSGLLKYTETQTLTKGPRTLDPWFNMSAESWARTEQAVIRSRNALWKILS